MQLRNWLSDPEPSSSANSSSASSWRSNDDESKPISQKVKHSYDALLAQPPESLALAAFLLGSASTLAVARIHKRFYRRFPTSDWITPDVFARRRWIKGVVTRCAWSVAVER